MKRFLLLAAAIAALTCRAQELDEEEDWEYASYDYEHWYVNAGGVLTLPQGGGSMRRLGGAVVRAGYYVDTALAIEGAAAWQENAAGIGVHGLWHWWLFEKFDPFFTFGANGWIKGEVGPSAGWGCYWHFNDNWSLRFDADATLGLDGANEMVYQLGLGIQFAF